jgi:hypothetical protein
MRVRTYEYYEVVSDLTGKGHSVHFRGALDGAERHMTKLLKTVDENGNLYLVRCQLIQAYKADKS